MTSRTSRLSPTSIRLLRKEAERRGLTIEGEDPKLHALPGADLPWPEWIRRTYPHVATAPFAPRHERLWNWFDALAPGLQPRPRVDVWPRGGAKSSTGELGCVRLGVRRTRRFVLYVCETQDQADKHVQSIGTLFESIAVGRAVNKYGHAKGWTRQQLRTANGFNVSGIGLDAATRGIKLDQYRPDLIIFDDVDHREDTTRTIEKKINAISQSIIPAGSTDCAVLFLQNLIHENSIVSQLVDGRADFLHNREVPCVEPAVRDLTYEPVEQDDGAKVYVITGGTPTWAGQDLVTCQQQINTWGLRGFLRESQHEVRGADGFFFKTSAITVTDSLPLGPPDHEGVRRPVALTLCRAGDLAATEGGGDWTVLLLMGLMPNGQVIVLDVIRRQIGADNVRALLQTTIRTDTETHGAVKLRLPQDPAQAGKYQAAQLRRELSAYKPIFVPPTGKKSTRAQGFAAKVNSGNVMLLRGVWNYAFLEELRSFKEDEDDQIEDQVDAAADAYNELDTFKGTTVIRHPDRKQRYGYA